MNPRRQPQSKPEEPCGPLSPSRSEPSDESLSILPTHCQGDLRPRYYSSVANKARPARNPNTLKPEESEPFRALLENRYRAEDYNGAALGRWLGISGSGISQMINGKTTMSIDTCRRIAAAVGKSLWLGCVGDEPLEGMRTIGSDKASRDALASAAREHKFPPWLTDELSRTPVPEAWPSLNPEFIWDLASIWLKWQGRLGSMVREKASGNR